MTIVREALAARAEIDIRLADQPGLEDSVFSELSSAVIYNVENFGYFISPNSTYMQRGKLREGTFTIPFICYWCPDPTMGVEFRGGPNDGKIMPLPREQDGRPVEHFTLPPERSAPTLADYSTEIYPYVQIYGEYTRVGIDSEHDRWVYQSRG